MGEVLETFINERRVEGALQHRLLALSPDVVSSLEHLLVALAPSANFLRDLLTLLDELSGRDAVNLKSLLDDPELVSIATGEFGRKDRQRRVRALLESRRFPLRSVIAEQLAQIQSRVMRQYGVQISFPDDFEGDQLTCALAFRSTEELRKLGVALLAVADSGAVAEMLSLLCGRIPESTLLANQPQKVGFDQGVG